MSDIPCEITEQILLRIPTRSLLRFKSVCKQWRSLISDPKFVKDHTNYAVLDQSNHKFISYQNTLKNSSIQCTIRLGTIDYEFLNSTKFELKFQNLAVLGSCNGLLLLGHVSRLTAPYMLWNPLLSEKYKVLPRSNFDLHYLCLFNGFGYVAYIDDYKFVKLSIHNESPFLFSKLQVEIYSLKTNSWKIIPGLPEIIVKYSSWIEKAGIHIQGSIYWMIYDKQNSAMIAFDLIAEKFKLIEIPCWGDNIIDYQKLAFLGKVRGCLGAYKNNCYEIGAWICNEDESKKLKWSKLLTIPGNFSMCTRVLSILDKDQVLLQWSERGSLRLVMYDSECGMFRDISCGDFIPSVHMVETLVSPVSY